MNKRIVWPGVMLLIVMMLSGCVWYGGHGYSGHRGYGYRDHDRYSYPDGRYYRQHRDWDDYRR